MNSEGNTPSGAEHPKEEHLNWNEVVEHPSTTTLMQEIYKSTKYDLFKLNTLFDLIDSISIEELNTPTIHGLTLLHFAAYVGNPLITTKLLHRQVAIDPRDNYNCTPLHLSLQSSAPLALGVAQMLLDHGADINAAVKDGGRGLDYAIQNRTKNSNECSAVNVLLRNRVEVNYQSEEFTPLTQTVVLGKNQILKDLLEHEANPNLPNKKGFTALYYAVKAEDAEAVRLLLSHKADPNVRDKDECAPICYSMLCNDITIAKLLVEHGADVNSRSKDLSTPLHLACVENKFDFVSLILKHGGRVNAIDQEGRTPLHYAASVGNVDIVNALLAKSAVIDAKEVSGWVPLHLAAKEGRDACLQILIRKSKKIDVPNNDGLTALHIAVNENRPGAARLLIEAGASINYKVHLRTPLHAAIQNNNCEMTELLLEKKASMDEFCQGSSTCIGLAIQNKNLDLIKILLKHKHLLSPKNYFLDMQIRFCEESKIPEAIPLLREALTLEQVPSQATQQKKPKKEKKPEVSIIVELSVEQQAQKVEEETKRKEKERIEKEAEDAKRAAEEAKKKEEKKHADGLKNAKDKSFNDAFDNIFNSLSSLKSTAGSTKDFFKGGTKITAKSYLEAQDKDYFKDGTTVIDRQALGLGILSATKMKRLNPELFEDLKTKFLNAEKEVQQALPSPVQPPQSNNLALETVEVSADNDKDKRALNRALHQQDKLNEAKAAEQRKLASSSTSAPSLIGPSSQKESNLIKEVMYEVSQLAALYQDQAKHKSLHEMKYDLVKISAFISKLTTPAQELFANALFSKVEELEILRNGALHLLEIHAENSSYSQEALGDFFHDFYRRILSSFSVIAPLSPEKDTRLSHIWARIKNKTETLPLKINEILTQMQNPALALETFKQFSVHYKNHQLNKENARSDVHDEIKNRVGILAAEQENDLSHKDKVMLAVEIAELYRQLDNSGYKNAHYPLALITARNEFAHEGKDIPDEVIDHFLRAYHSSNMKNK